MLALPAERIHRLGDALNLHRKQLWINWQTKYLPANGFRGRQLLWTTRETANISWLLMHCPRIMNTGLDTLQCQMALQGITLNGTDDVLMVNMLCASQ